jgi:hypothetical protein
MGTTGCIAGAKLTEPTRAAGDESSTARAIGWNAQQPADLKNPSLVMARAFVPSRISPACVFRSDRNWTSESGSLLR